MGEKSSGVEVVVFPHFIEKETQGKVSSGLFCFDVYIEFLKSSLFLGSAPGVVSLTQLFQ